MFSKTNKKIKSVALTYIFGKSLQGLILEKIGEFLHLRLHSICCERIRHIISGKLVYVHKKM